MKSPNTVLALIYLLVTLSLFGSSAFSQVTKKTTSSENTLFISTDSSDNSTSIHFFDDARLEAEYLSVIKERDQRAYEYLYSSVENIHGSLRELVTSYKELQKLSDQSLTSSVSVQDFLSAVRSYQQELTVVKDKLNSLTLLPFLREDTREELSGKLQLEPLKQHYREQFEKVQQTINDCRFQLTLPSGALHTQIGIGTEELGNLPLYSAEQLNNMQGRISQLRVMKTKERNVIDQGINTFTRKALEKYIDVFGTSEQYRTSSDEAGQLKAAEALYDVFWARFYIRSVYGIKIGAVPVNYQKRIFNIDYLISSVRIGNIPLWEDIQLREALNLATEAAATLHDQDAGYFSKFIRDFSILISGKRAENYAKQFIIGLVKMDLEEELRLGTSEGLKNVRASYRARYYSNPENKRNFKDKASTIFGSSDDPESDVKAIEAGTLKGVIAQCTSVLEQLENRLEEARTLENSLALLTSGSKTLGKRKRRTDEL